MEKTQLFDVGFRKQLVDGGKEAMENSEDPMIQLARRINHIVRKRSKWYEEEIQAVEKVAEEKIAKARFDIYGKTIYPDANFTLRLSYGTVKGYESWWYVGSLEDDLLWPL